MEKEGDRSSFIINCVNFWIRVVLFEFFQIACFYIVSKSSKAHTASGRTSCLVACPSLFIMVPDEAEMMIMRNSAVVFKDLR